MLVMGTYSRLSAGVTMVYLFVLCLVSLLSRGFAASALVWVYDFLKCKALQSAQIKSTSGFNPFYLREKYKFQAAE